MLQSVWTEAGIVLRDVEPAELQPGWVRLKVRACGICGSDLHSLKSHGPMRTGGTPGHELVATLLDSNAGTLFPDAVYAVEPWLACRRCDYCLRGRSEHCRNASLLGATRPGGMAEFIDVPEGNIHPVSSALSDVEASITEPFAVCTRAIHLAELKLDTRVLVLGAGSLGLISGVLARDFCESVAISVRYPHQEEAALSLGLEPTSEHDVVDFAKEFEPDVVIETVGGVANTIEQAVACCKPGGRIVVLGLFSRNPELDMRALVHKELRITGSKVFGMSEHGPEFRASTKILPRYTEELKTLQTHQFPLSRVADAFSTAIDKQARAIKITVVPGG
jgi:threonine dehydrogenase-like Zn-dependent dehydrogenase